MSSDAKIETPEEDTPGIPKYFCRSFHHHEICKYCYKNNPECSDCSFISSKEIPICTSDKGHDFCLYNRIINLYK